MKFDWWKLKLVKKSVKGHLEMRKRGKESFFDSLPVISSKFFFYIFLTLFPHCMWAKIRKFIFFISLFNPTNGIQKYTPPLTSRVFVWPLLRRYAWCFSYPTSFSSAPIRPLIMTGSNARNVPCKQRPFVSPRFFVSYTPNLPGKKRTISTFVDQNLHLLLLGDIFLCDYGGLRTRIFYN